MKNGFTPPLFRKTRRFIFPFFNKVGGFTILELLGAILVISIGVLTAYGVVQRLITYTIDSSDRIVSAYLAKEGVEIVRNIRDTNWVASPARDWDEGLFLPEASGYEIDYNDPAITACPNSCDYDNLRFLRIDGSGYYNYSAGTNSKFKRKITITSIAANEIKVVVEVLWSKRGQTSSIKVQENIYDWK